LGSIGPKAEAAVPHLIKSLDDPDNPNPTEAVSVSRRAASSLGQIGPKAQAAIPVLMNLLKCKDDHLRNQVVLSLARIGGSDDEKTLKALISILQDPNECSVHGMAARGLGEIGPSARAAVPALIALLDVKKGLPRLDYNA
jgi:HEAT repeat protein